MSEERESRPKEKGTPLRGGAFFTFGLGPHFSWLIAGESESLVCSLCDLLCFCVLSVVNQIPCDQGVLPKHVMSV